MDKTLFTDASQRLEKALNYVSISDDAIEHLKYPKASLLVINTKGTRDYYLS